ncbi:hypothetical protein CGCF415_v013945 [Colletotrichum fructicola]|uniref:Secreted protein n=1 Tax=Colletotrichum fructicola (strain Nara gc5) TaxID=1213859 RepID=A0A7J6IH56_COLFN|nr:uncharacterized protein CGMCC3_g10967 [Colletotrichum fructicola]KAF4474766.1 hypothetical protein CGGC5_v015776 [Colletotrichum fructicola Nara gc5]KAI8274347.1 hypothetical protein K4K60_009804 [Colletotrichum sp. SAR11_57]KAE9572806.1 hypothetical protein CGMCC3_g10967 [Colletotrichum fructicola]KAF4419787.1 hypothetical protein CFRS1_v005530 [Colletotrichum fructicola]KAF4887337.1 hypothetical protein CGCFRS4_v010546 [Colletotrichum fructicola]
MVRALLIAALASAALGITVPVPADSPAPAGDAYVPTTEELGDPALAVPAQADDAAIPDATEWTSLDNGDEGGVGGGVGDVSEPKLPAQRRAVDTGNLDTSALDTSSLDTDSLNTALNIDSLNTESLDTSSLNTDSFTSTLPTSTNIKRRSAVMW